MLYKKRHGFSIVEMLIVIAILGVLVMVGLISYGGMSSTTNTTKCRDNMQAIRIQLKTYYLRKHHFPQDLSLFLQDSAYFAKDYDGKLLNTCEDRGTYKYDPENVDLTTYNKTGIPPNVKCYGTAHGSMP